MIGALERRQISRRAGRSAAREYERQKRAWRVRNRTVFRVITAIAALIVIASLVLAWGRVWPWACGLVAGMALAFAILAREVAPPWIENHAVGARGEEATAKVLAPLLKRGWVIAHDVERRGFNVDHVLIGPSGVFVLETKNLSGTVQVDGDSATLTRPGADRPDYTGPWWARQARRHSAEINQLMRHRTGHRPWVTAVVVIWAEFPQRCVTADKVTFVRGTDLVEWLERQAVRLDPAKIESLAAGVRPAHRMAEVS